ncbi:MAG: methyltransferase [Desulfurococcales archaeon]|nr:methyltransferase [Desulfurococcales archaeon]
MGYREVTRGLRVRNTLHKGFRVNYAIHPCVYEPEEDSFLLADSLVNAFHNGLQPNSVIELGVGSGYISSLIFSLWDPRLFVGTDVNRFAIEATKSSLSMHERALKKSSIVVCDRDSCVSDEWTFDLAISNPPYLPVEDEVKDECNELLIRGWSCKRQCLEGFCASLCKRGRVVFMVLSNLSPLDGVFECMEQFNCKPKIIRKRKVFFEEILVVMGEHALDD